MSQPITTQEFHERMLNAGASYTFHTAPDGSLYSISWSNRYGQGMVELKGSSRGVTYLFEPVLAAVEWGQGKHDDFFSRWQKSQAELIDSQAEVFKLRVQVHQQDEYVRHLEADNSKLKSAHDGACNRIKELTAEVVSLHRQRSELQSEVTKRQKENSELLHTHHDQMQGYRATLEKLQAEVDRLQRAEHDVDFHIGTLVRENKKLKTRMEQLQLELGRAYLRGVEDTERQLKKDQA